jgi:NADH-quinone oxidoreductase subunit K
MYPESAATIEGQGMTELAFNFPLALQNAPAQAQGIELQWYLALSAVLFTIGVVGVIIKRNVISRFMCIELMLNAVNLTFVAFASFFRDVSGQLFVFIVMTVAAAEAAVGLGIIIAIFRNRESLDVDDANILKL